MKCRLGLSVIGPTASRRRCSALKPRLLCAAQIKIPLNIRQYNRERTVRVPALFLALELSRNGVQSAVAADRFFLAVDLGRNLRT
jgi:hypothetical protein